MWLLGAVVLCACAGSVVEIVEATADGDGRLLEIGVDDCGGRYETRVKEDATTIEVGVTRIDATGPGGPDCLDTITIVLGDPIGDRELIDDGSGAHIEVTFDPWNKQLYSYGEFRAALEEAAECIRQDPGMLAEVRDGPLEPKLIVIPPELKSGEQRADPTAECYAQHVDPLRR